MDMKSIEQVAQEVADEKGLPYERVFALAEVWNDAVRDSDRNTTEHLAAYLRAYAKK